MDARTRERLVHAKELFEHDDFSGAEPLLREIVEKHEGLADVHDMLGVIAHARGDFAIAEERFERALAINPGYTEAALNLAVTYNQPGRYDRAKALFDKGIVGKPHGAGLEGLDPFVRGKLANMHADVAKAYRDSGLVQEAIVELEKAIFLCPQFIDLRTTLGRLCRTNGDHLRAKAHFEAALAVRPSYVKAHVQLGLVLQDLGDAGGAQRAFEDVLRFAPDHPQAKLYLRALKEGLADPTRPSLG